MSEEQVCIIIGASHAGAQLANSVRKEGWEGRILVIGDEPIAPYHRPPLSKAFLMQEKTADQLEIFKPSVYEKAGVEFKLNTRVSKIDRANKSITLDSGETLPYTKLALCTGARVRKLDIPGADLPGVHYLRDQAPARRGDDAAHARRHSADWAYSRSSTLQRHGAAVGLLWRRSSTCCGGEISCVTVMSDSPGE